MTLFAWRVYADRYPFAAPAELGLLEAPTLAAAKCAAAERWPGVPTLIQSAASARVRPLSAMAPPDAPLPPNPTRGPGRRRTESRTKQRYRDFAAEKRRTDANRQGGER
jgi:hypothetical protein